MLMAGEGPLYLLKPTEGVEEWKGSEGFLSIKMDGRPPGMSRYCEWASIAEPGCSLTDEVGASCWRQWIGAEQALSSRQGEGVVATYGRGLEEGQVQLNREPHIQQERARDQVISKKTARDQAPRRGC